MSRRKRRLRRVLSALLAIAILLGLAGGAGYGYATFRPQVDRLQAELSAEVTAGQQQIQSGKTLLAQALATGDVALIGRAERSFAEARASFGAVRDLTDGSQLLQRLELIPIARAVVERRHKAADGLAATGVALADAGSDMAALDRRIISAPGQGGGGSRLLASLEEARKGLAVVRADIARAWASATTVDASVLPGAQQANFTRMRSSVGQALQSLLEFDRLAPALVEILGGNGPRTYLVEQMNPAELRAGGGFIGSMSLVTADRGVLKLVKSGDAYAPRASRGQAGYVAPPDSVGKLIGTTSWSLVDSNAFVDFPTNAASAESFTQKELGTKVDGVIALDPDAVAAVLGVVGPISVPGYNITVQAQGFGERVYQLENGSQQLPNHKSFLAALAAPMTDRVSALAPASWPALMTALNSEAQGRHLQAFFNLQAVQDEMVRAGWAGTANPTGASDFMMEVEANLGASKSNHFLTRQYDVTVTQTPTALHHRVVVNLTHRTPPNQDAPGGNRTYTVYVRFLLPKQAKNLAAGGLQPPHYQDPELSGLQVADGWIDIPINAATSQGSGQVAFEYDTSWATDETIYWQKQPGTADDAVHVSWVMNGRTTEVSGHLTQDLLVQLTADGVSLAPGRAATAQLPGVGF
jgi:hypothetical protein